jgi:hypothetical protein
MRLGQIHERHAAKAILAALPLVLGGAPSALMAGPARDFHADLSAENETKYTESPAIGTADFHLELDTLTITWKVTFRDLQGPLETAWLYGPAQPGANGKAFLKIAAPGARNPITGTAAVTEAQVQYLLYGWTYVNLVTKNHPNGEIRGQLDVRAPKDITR